MIYFDNAATTKPDRNAVNKATLFTENKFFNPSALYNEGLDVQSELKNARCVLLSKIADDLFFEWIFTSCGTESNNQAIFSFCKTWEYRNDGGRTFFCDCPVYRIKKQGRYRNAGCSFNYGR